VSVLVIVTGGVTVTSTVTSTATSSQDPMTTTATTSSTSIQQATNVASATTITMATSISDAAGVTTTAAPTSTATPEVFNLNITDACALNCLAQIPNAGGSVISQGTLSLGSVTLLCTDSNLRNLTVSCVGACANVDDTTNLEGLLTVCGSIINAIDPTTSSVSLPTARVSTPSKAHGFGLPFLNGLWSIGWIFGLTVMLLLI
ncbi:hypothetical protein HDU76_009040, partial [Blyttiomyces sp. JEL0837]